MRRDFSHPCVWTALQVILINRNAPDSPLEYSPFASESPGLSSYNNLFHAFNMLQFGQLYELGNEGHKKLLTLIKLLWMSSFISSEFLTAFGRRDAR